MAGEMAATIWRKRRARLTAVAGMPRGRARAVTSGPRPRAEVGDDLAPHLPDKAHGVHRLAVGGEPEDAPLCAGGETGLLPGREVVPAHRRAARPVDEGAALGVPVEVVLVQAQVPRVAGARARRHDLDLVVAEE